MDKQLDLPNLLRSRLTMVATLAAMKAGELLKRAFGTHPEFTTKEGRHNLVTEWDNKAESLIIDFIKTHFPEHRFLAEESGESGEVREGIQWIIDPLDGTVNFVHSIPMFSVSIAAAVQNEILAGAIYNPMVEELFIAEKNNGAYLNGTRLKVTETAVLDSAICATGFPYNVHENPLCCIDHFNTFAKMGIPLRRIGSAALDLAYVAAGRYDGFWEVSLRPWDYAAGKLIVEEAGGTFTNFAGEPYKTFEEGPIVASNGILHDQILKNIKATLEKSNKE
ncbi:inositol monophosphatase family protein [Simkania sp.]|uniref:inositol monophosphatase family protein n=1 Tax=Simkania sp. TaxID=34094 RepID=UPI003B52D372